jgi:hypothetical protein
MKLSQPAGCSLTASCSKSALKKLPPDEELELLLEDELELEEELLELLLLDDEELLELEELLLDDELLELLDDELLLELELLDESSLPLQVGKLKLPSCVPWKPNVAL